jgi:hypothetical protein
VLCPESHFERSASGKRQALFRTGIFPELPPGTGKRPAKPSGANVRPVQRGIPKGTVPTAGNPSAENAGRCEKTAGFRKIDENLIFAARAFAFYPLSLTPQKILRPDKIANKFAFVFGLFVSLRLKPKNANRP